MSKLDLFKGLKTKIFTSDRRNNSEAKNGIITDVTNRVVVATYKDVEYRESFSIGQVLSDNNVDVKLNGEWTSLKTLLLRG
ncbi:hypothetical protein ABFP60_02015 [Clostridioides difficile]